MIANTTPAKVYITVLTNRLQDLQYEINKQQTDNLPIGALKNISDEETIKMARLDFAKILLKEANRLLNEL